MGFFDSIFKKKQEKITVRQDELDSWIENKKTETDKQQHSFDGAIRQKLISFIYLLSSNLENLKNYDLDKKKAEDRFKLIVKENLFNYINYSERLLKRMQEEKDKQVSLKDISAALSGFLKKSRMSYEKSTILIGDEIGAVDKCIKDFWKDLEKATEDNTDFFKEKQLVESISAQKQKIQALEKEKEDVQGSMKSINNSIIEMNVNIENNMKKIKNIRASEEYRKQLDQERMNEDKKKELDRRLLELKNAIDFKSLSGFYHTFKKEMDLVSYYRENFKAAFLKADGEDLKALLIESRLDNDDLSKSIDSISKLRQEIDSFESAQFDDRLLEEENKKLQNGINELSIKLKKEESRKEKTNQEINALDTRIREILEKNNIILSQF